jgi:ribonuclease D
VHYESIHSSDALRSFLDSIRDEPRVAFDTEFVSEDRFRPELCLIQVAAGSRLAVIDPYTTKDTLPFWEFISTPGRIILAHAAREEARFCYRFTGKPIAGLFDVQLAAGFIGHEYPISLGNLVHRLQGKTLPKGETRTNWRTRPLTASQIEYALHDVTELDAMYQVLAAQVESLGRRSWLDEESDVIQNTIIEMEDAERWRRVSGSNGLPPRQLEIVRQIWLWREHRARGTDQPPRRVLRDDLIVELAKRMSSDIDRIRDIRGMERRGLVNQYEEISQAIQTALDTPDVHLPRRPRSGRKPVSPMLAQFLSTAIACVCRQHRMAPSIVGNSDDVRELLAYELERAANIPQDPDEQLPALLRGWRGEVVGKSFQDLLAGRLAIRVVDRNEEQPLEFVEVPAPNSNN